jgi:VCBS repeat-containing protein
MDAFDNPARNGMTGPERDGASNEASNRAVSGGEFLAAAANVTAAASTIPLAIQAILVPDASGRIVLPAGASIDDITISGTDLIVTLPNGQVFIIPGGAVDVPAIVVDGDTVPASTVAQLLENLGELNPEAGVRSSGGNFADPEAPIQDAYALGDLLPYTQLAFPQPENREFLPAVQDTEPTIVIVTPDQPAGIAAATASVNEAGLPARGNEPAGSNSAANSETTTGSIVYDTGDGLDTLTINGTAITAVGQVITTPLGQLTITSLTPGNVGYSYTLTDNTNANNNLTDPFTVVVTDNDGDTATATLTISVVDDVPTARNDTDQVAAGSFAPETGNVLTGAGTTSGAAGADTPGADGASLTGIRGASSEGGFSAPGTVQGQYGALTINAQGGYTYVRNPGTRGGVNDVFTYQITDGDGDTTTATLTVSIADAPTVITFVPGDGEGDGGTVVYEADLGPREGETPGSAFAGSDASTSGTITFTAIDGIGSVSIGGVVVTPGSLPQTVSSDATGTLVVTGYSFDPATGEGSVSYVYTLIDNRLDGDGTTLSFALVITDADGDAATDTLDIDIVDDAPTARADVDSVTEDSGNGDNPATADGNVLTGVGGNDENATDGVADVQGADGATVTAVAGGTVGEPLAGAYGSLTLNSDGSYSYVLDNVSQPVQGLAAGETLTETFTYTITDGDGDTSTTTLTITINGADDGVTVGGLNAEGGEVVVDEDNLADGSSPDAAALTQPGSFTVSTPDGLGNVTIGGTQVVTGGVFTAGTAPSPLGTVNITGFTPTLGADGSVIGGTFTYNYVLSDNTLTHTSQGEDFVGDSFPVVVTDSDGSSANASLDVRIVDDVPTAQNDADSVTEDSGNGDNPAVADGNVLTGLGGGDANATDGVADTQGADGAAVTAVAGGALGEPFAGAFGMLTLNSDGSYRYVLNNQAQPVQGLSAGETLTEVFTYTITDGDGDTSTATLTITINGADDGVTVGGLNAEGAEVIVNEDDLSDGSSPDAAALTQTSNFSISTPDGLGNVTIGGTQVVTNGVFTAGTATSPLGTVNITGFTPIIGADGSVIGGTFTYNYVLSDNTLTHTSQGEDFVGDSFAVVVTDGDGSTANASLDVRIIDDVPTAANDSATAAEDTSVVINVLANDVRGADGVNPATGVALATAPGKGSVVYNGDGTFTYTPTAGQEGTDSFTYTITDGDGDTSTATVTVQLAKDSVPTINLGADNSVNEAGLPAGSNAASNSETTTGSFTLTTGNDSVASLVINGVDVTAGGTVTTPRGVLTVTVSGGAYSYSYTLTTNTSGDNTSDSFTAVVTDSDGDTATDTLVINIIDDVPTARADVDSVTEDGPLTANGNVLTGVGGNDANNTDGVADTQGADGATVTGLTGGAVGTPLAGAYGTLTLNSDGSYSYVLNNAAQPVQGLSAGQTLTDTFTYTITDGDGDPSTTTLTITINGANDGVTINGLDAAGAELLVDEDDLPTRPGEARGSDTSPESLTDSDSFTVSTPDGMGTVVLNSFNGVPLGVPLTLVVANGTFTPQSVATAYGTLNVTSFTAVTGADGSVIGGTFTYSYTLTDNRADHPAAGQDNRTDSVGVTVTDIDGSTASATIDIRITDDVPDAINDGATQALENGPVTINVLANDVQGADSVQPSAVQLVAGSLTGTGTLVNNGNGTFTYAPGLQETGTISFQYRITDGDGDTDTATATITLAADSAPQIRTPVNVTVDEDGLPGANIDNGLPGEVTSTGSASANGTIIVSFGSDVPTTLAGSLVLNDSAALDTHLTVGGVPVTFAKVGNDLVGSVAGNEVIRISLTTAAVGPGATEITYGYTVTLSQAIDQAVPGSEDTDFLSGVGFTVTDSDGTQSSGSFGVTIVDDLPTLNVSDAPTTVVEGATANGTWTLDRGADGVSSVNVSFGSGSATLSLAPGSSVSITQPTGTLTVNANGTFSFAAAGNQNNAANPSATFTLSAVDRDGDPTSDSLTIAITDGANPANATPITLTVNEAALPDGSNPPSNAETASGNLSFTAGSDTLSGFAFTGVAGLVANLDGAGTDIFWTLAPGGQTIIGSLTLGGPAAITISLTAPASIAPGATANATVTVTLADNLPHALANAAQTQALGTVTVRATDTDGDAATGVVTVQVTDDVPTARADVDSVTEDGPLTADGNVLTGSGGADANATDGVSDIRGADGANVTGVSFGATVGAVGAGLAGAYGTLTLNADGSYSYALNNANTAVQGLSTGQTLTEVFTYTITDSDGDPSTTTLTITINGANDGVTINGLAVPGGEEIVNEDDLSDGSSPNAAALTQTGSFTVDAPDGLNNVTIGTAQVMTNGVFTPGLTTSSPLGTVTITGFTPVTAADGSVIGGTFSYSYTLADNTLTHPLAGEDTVSDSFAVTVTDSDGSTANASLDITVIDDVPTASAEPNQNVAEGATVTGTLDFVQGADGATVTQINGTLLVFGGDGFSQVIDIGAGTIKVKADGSYSFTADASVPGAGTAAATYTVRDGDGDTSTAPINFTITDANVPTAGQTLASVDDDALAGGNPASTIGDLADPNSDGDNNHATFSGTLNLNFGGDGAGSVNFAGMNGLFVVIGQESVQLGWNAGTNTLTGTGPRGVLFTVQVTNPATGAYKVTLVDNVLHTAGGNENDATATLGFTVLDSDGSTANGTLQITFDDDAPTVALAAVAEPTLAADETTLGTNPFASFASMFTPTFGADGQAAANATTYALGINPGATGLVDTATGTAVTLVMNGTTVEGRAGGLLVFTVSVAADGTVTLDQQRAVVHANTSNPNDSASLSADNLITLTATITDGDGDTASATANIGQNLTFLDDGPSVTAAANGAAVVVNDETATSSQASTINTGAIVKGDDPNVGGTGAISIATSGSAVATATPTYGADGAAASNPLSYALSVTNAASGLTVTDGSAINLVNVGGVIVGQVSGGTFNGQAAFAIAIDPATGIARVEQYLSLNHPNAANPDDSIQLLAGRVGVVVTATDRDGDSTTSNTADISAQIRFEDDGPTAAADTKSVTEGAVANGNVLTDNVDVFGADGAATTTPAGGVVGVRVAGGDTTTAVTTGTGTTISTALGDLTLNANGTYTYDAKPNTTASTVTDTFVYTIRDADGDLSTTTLTITIQPVTLAPDNQTKAVNEAGLDLVQDAGDVAPGTVTGSNPSATTESVSGTLAVAGTGVTYTAQTVEDALGKFVLNTNGTYTYSLKSALDGPTLNNGVTTTAAVRTFTYTATDANGNSVTGTVTIDVIDDVPTARNDADNVGGATATDGNVVTGAGTTGGAAGADTFGADGASVTHIQSNNVGGAATAIPGGGVTINGQYGTLTIGTNGQYTYNRTSDSAGTDTFTYRLTDGDGDESTATLTITLPDKGRLVVGSNDSDDGVAPDGPHVVDQTPNTTGPINGQDGDDVLIGDPGALATVTPGDTANIVFVLDTSGSMDAGISFNGGTTSRLQALQFATNAAIDDLAASGAANVRIHLVQFNEAGGPGITFDLIVGGVVNTAAVAAAHAVVDGFDDTFDGPGTNYESALQQVQSWVNGSSVAYSINGAEAFDSNGGTANGTAVLLNAYDTKVAVVSAWNGTTQTNVTGTTGAMGVSGNGDDVDSGEFLRFDFGVENNFGVAGFDPSPNTGSTGYGTQFATFNGPPIEFATFAFDGITGTESLNYTIFYTDNTSSTGSRTSNGSATLGTDGKTIAYIEFTGGSGNGMTVEMTGVTLDYDGPLTNAGAKNKVVFISDGEPNAGGSFTDEVTAIESAFGPIEAVGINISANALSTLSTVEGSGGSATNITTGEQLDAVIGELSGGTVIADNAGGDIINGGGGDDIIYGDVPFTDTLAAAAGLSSPPSSGWTVFQQLEAGQGTGSYATWTRADTINYLRVNQAQIAQESGRTGGNDIISGGAGNDIIYGQEGADWIHGGAGNDTLNGGSGADQFRFKSANNGTDTVTDFTIGTDRIGFLDNGTTGSGSVNFAATGGTAAGAALAAGDFQARTSIANINTADDNHVILITATQTSAQIAAATNAATDAYVVVFNSTTNRAEIWFDNDWSTAGAERSLIAVLNGVTAGQVAALTAANFVVYNNAIDPIVLDLDDNGIAFGATAAFDINADGVADRVTWNSSNDGILAVDLDGNGTIDSGREIFTPQFAGGNFASGAAALASLDGNGDGVIDAKDAAFTDLLIWRDANANGVSDAGELSTLADHGIAAISTTTAAADEMIDDQSVVGRGDFTRTDGTTGKYVEVQLDTQLGTRAAARETEDIQRAAGNQALTNSLVAASLIAVHETQSDSAAPAAPAVEDAPAPVQADADAAAATVEAPAETSASLAGDSSTGTPEAAAPENSSTLHADDTNPASVDDTQDGGWQNEPANDADTGASDALFDMVGDHGPFNGGTTMDGLLSLAAMPAEAPAVGAVAAAHDPAATAVLAEVLEGGDNAVDQLIDAVTGGHEPVQIAAGEAPAFDLAQFLDQKIAPDVAFPTSQPLEAELHNMAAA